jgi:hypothetical protein
MSRQLHWADDESFTLAGTEFRIENFGNRRSRPESFTLAKPRWLIDEYLDLASEFTGGRVVELGIKEGGSTAFFTHLLEPSGLFAVDITSEPNSALADFISSRNLAGTVHAEYGVDQGDTARLEDLLVGHLGTDPLDLVVDDASHLLGPTTASFGLLFPRLRPGGVFILEDWSASHTWERAVRADDRFAPEVMSSYVDQPVETWDLSRLVLELVIASAYEPHAVADVRVRDGLAIVRRGEGTLDPGSFDLSACYGEVGRAVLGSAG